MVIIIEIKVTMVTIFKHTAETGESHSFKSPCFEADAASPRRYCRVGIDAYPWLS